MSFSYTNIILSDTEEPIYRRGYDLFQQGKAQIRPIGTARCYGTVDGTDTYEIRLGFRKIGSPNLTCTCPYFTQHELICKHIIACSLAWDSGRGVPAPEEEEIMEVCLKPYQDFRHAIAHAFEKPLEANLDLIREATDHGKWVRPHVHLPRMPRACLTPLCNWTQIKLGEKEILGWMNKNAFDPYFCAGEVMAVFCEYVAWIERGFHGQIPKTDIQKLAEFVIELFHTIIYEGIDGSDGIHIFGEAYIERFLGILEKMEYISSEKYIYFHSILNQ